MSDGLSPVGSGLPEMLKRLGMPEEFDVSRLADDWAEVAGAPFAGLSSPVAFGAGELVVSVVDGTAASLLKFRIGDLVERLAARYGAGRVTSVRLTVRGRKKAPDQGFRDEEHPR